MTQLKTVKRPSRANKTTLYIKILVLVAALIILLLIAGGGAYARADEGQELSDTILKLLDELDLTELQSYLDAHGNSFIGSFGNTAKEIVEYLVRGNLNVDYSNYVGELFSVLFKNVIALIPAFAQIVAISILCAIVSGAEGGILGKSTSKVVRLACYSLIVLIVTSMLVGIVGTAVTSITNVKRQVEIITPIMVTLTVLCGGSGSGAIYQPSALFLSGGAIEIISGFVFPATVAVVVLNFMSKLNPQISFSGTAKLIKSILKWAIGITVTVFSLFLTVQSSASSLFDGIFFKATKYLLGNSVPIVGNFLSSGVDMIVSAGSLIKSSVGLCGIIILLSEIIQPVILFAAFSLILKLVGAIVQPLGENTLYSLFSDLSNDVEYFIAGLLTAAFMYGLMIMLMINSATDFI